MNFLLQIIWDPQKGRWLTAGASEEEEVVTAPPPAITQVGAGGENRFRSGGLSARGAANRYVDVLAGSGSTTTQPPSLSQPSGPREAAANPLMPPMPVGSQPRFFVPAPVRECLVNCRSELQNTRTYSANPLSAPQ